MSKSWRTAIYLDPELKLAFKKKWKASLSFWISQRMRDWINKSCRCPWCVYKGEKLADFRKASQMIRIKQ